MRRNYFFSLPYISCVMAHISFTASNEFHKFSDGFSVVDWKLHIHSHVAITHRVRIIHHDAAKLRSSFRIFGSNGSNASREDTECRLSRAPVFVWTIWTFSPKRVKISVCGRVFSLLFLVYVNLPLLDCSCRPSGSEGQQIRTHGEVCHQIYTEIAWNYPALAHSISPSGHRSPSPVEWAVYYDTREIQWQENPIQ